jgi:hypothetical protein
MENCFDYNKVLPNQTSKHQSYHTKTIRIEKAFVLLKTFHKIMRTKFTTPFFLESISLFVILRSISKKFHKRWCYSKLQLSGKNKLFEMSEERRKKEQRKSFILCQKFSENE